MFKKAGYEIVDSSVQKYEKRNQNFDLMIMFALRPKNQILEDNNLKQENKEDIEMHNEEGNLNYSQLYKSEEGVDHADKLMNALRDRTKEFSLASLDQMYSSYLYQQNGLIKAYDQAKVIVGQLKKDKDDL